MDKLHLLEPGAVRLEGYVGKRIDDCIGAGVMKTDYSHFVRAFEEHWDDGLLDNGWTGEFWGKWFTSAVLAYRYRPCREYRAILDDAALKLIGAAEPNGRLSSYGKDFGDWDVWGRKYVLLGLAAYYEVTGCQEALDTAAAALDSLIGAAGPGKRKLTETGLTLLEALASCSVLEPIMIIYNATKNQKYLDFAEYLTALWSEPSAYTETGIRLVEDGLAKRPPVLISSPKAYEMTSCYEGLCELYRATGDRKYYDAVLFYGETVREREIMAVGSGSSRELWCDGAFRQTAQLESPMETCVTATWMKFCFQLLRLTGDSLWADEMEKTLYNALLAALVPEGNWWAYFTQMAGERAPSPLQVPAVNSSCCVVNGPRGLLTAPEWAVMKQGPSEIVVNLYCEGTVEFHIEGHRILLVQETGYPRTELITVRMDMEAPAEFTLCMRIPAWSSKNRLTVNGQEYDCVPGTYCRIRRTWNMGDVLEYRPDMRGRVVSAPKSPDFKAVLRGPIVLAMDSRLVEEREICLWPAYEGLQWKHDRSWNVDYVLPETITEEERYIELIPEEGEDDRFWMKFRVPFLRVPSHFVGHAAEYLVLCDYASAGNEYSETDLFRVWMQEPQYMNQLYPKGTWRILFDGSSGRPKVPQLIK